MSPYNIQRTDGYQRREFWSSITAAVVGGIAAAFVATLVIHWAAGRM
jgi:hypothetical protein